MNDGKREPREDRRVREASVNLGLTWEQVFAIRKSLQTIQGMVDEAVAAFDDPFRVVIKDVDKKWRFRDKCLNVPGSYPCELVNETGEDIAIWFHASASRRAGPEYEVLDQQRKHRSQPIVIESGDLVPVRFEGTGLESVWVSVAYLVGTEFTEVNPAERNGADMGINNP
jgi:hypothetical protein